MLTSDTTTQHVTGMTQIPATSSLLNGLYGKYGRILTMIFSCLANIGCNIITHQPSLLQPNPMMMSTSLLNGNGLHSHDRDGSPGHHDNDSSLDEPNGKTSCKNDEQEKCEIGRAHV